MELSRRELWYYRFGSYLFIVSIRGIDFFRDGMLSNYEFFVCGILYIGFDMRGIFLCNIVFL